VTLGLALVLAGLAALPLAGLLWVRWRFRPARMDREAERLLADARRRMEQRTDEQLQQLLIDELGRLPQAASLCALARAGDIEALARKWGDGWPQLVSGQPPLGLQQAIDLGAAIAVLSSRRRS
jgi:hypothetical protein